MKKNLYILSLLCLMLGCAERDDVTGIDVLKSPIRISSDYPLTGYQTRATIDGGFVAGDEMGVFVVDYDEEGNPGTMMLQGNRASNIRFTMQDDGSWSAPVQLYWDVRGKSADFYGYYPFDGNLSSLTAQPFVVEADQNSEATSAKLAGYTASDLLWAKKEQVAPTSEAITLQYHHLMAGVIIHLERGTGFTAEEWAELDKMLFIKNTIADGTVDLTTGTVTVNGEGQVQTIRPLSYNGSYRAIVYPQTVAAGKELIQVFIDGKAYGLTKTEAMEFQPGKMHQFTVVINRSTATGDYICTLADEAITPWVEDGDLHEGLVREYVLAELTEAGTLAATLQAKGIDLSNILALKISGPVNGEDYGTIHQMKKLTHLNLIKAIPDDGRLYGINDIPLEKVLFPEKGLKTLDGFNGTQLSGSLVIPEGVEEVAGFWGCPFTGTLTLPSTLKRLYLNIGAFKGDFVIPSGLEEWGAAYNGATGSSNNYDMTGTLVLPSTLKRITGRVPAGLTGTINIPQGCEITSNGTFVDSKCTGVILPEGMTTIPDFCFSNSEIRGDVRIPSSVIKIKYTAFAGSKISHVIFSDNVKEIDPGAFKNCSRLSGTITIPKNTIRVNSESFRGCPMLTGIVFHKDVAVIDQYAFAECYNLNSIVCEGEEPPVVVDDAFLGVPKDNFTVEVPKGCVEKYRNARGWSDFKRIAEYSNFVCRPATACALNNAHQEQLVLNADGAWTVTSKPDWLTLSSTSGTGKTPITATFQPLSHGAGNRTGDVVFEMTTGGKTVTTSCKVSQYDYEHEEDSYLTLQTATKGNRGGINIVFVGDGYDGASISDGSYLDLVQYQTECFFAIEPFKSMREYFNVYVTFPLSQEKGVNTMYTYVNNRFGTLQGMSSLLEGQARDGTSMQLIMETDEVRQYVIDNTPVTEDNQWYSLIIAVPNSTDYEGNTVYMNGGMNIAICPPSDQAYPRDTRGVIQHEAGGHAFAYLGDEMIAKNAFAPASVKREIEEKHGWGWYDNLATTGKLNSVPWAEFIFDPDYSDYVDVYEGGYGYTRGIYRPEANSCMNYGIPYYNTPSRLSIYRRILAYANEEFRMENFRAQDTFEWGATTITRSAARNVEALTPITAGSHHAPVIIKYREVGDRVRAIRAKLKAKNEK